MEFTLFTYLLGRFAGFEQPLSTRRIIRPAQGSCHLLPLTPLPYVSVPSARGENRIAKVADKYGHVLRQGVHRASSDMLDLQM